MDNLLRAFPARKIRILDSGITKPWKILLGMVLIALLGAFPLLFLSDLRYDMKIAKNPVIDNQSDVSGTCRSKLFLVNCEAKIVYRLEGKSEQLTAKREQFFVDFSLEHTTGVVRSADDPSLITTSMGIDTINNRIITMAVWIGLFLALLPLGIRGMLVSAQVTKLIADATPVELAPQVVTLGQANGTWTYKAQLNGKTVKGSVKINPTKPPFFIDDAGHTALSVNIVGTRTFILLDEELQRIDLTDAERSALRAARNA